MPRSLRVCRGRSGRPARSGVGRRGARETAGWVRRVGDLGDTAIGPVPQRDARAERAVSGGRDEPGRSLTHAGAEPFEHRLHRPRSSRGRAGPGARGGVRAGEGRGARGPPWRGGRAGPGRRHLPGRGDWGGSPHRGGHRPRHRAHPPPIRRLPHPVAHPRHRNHEDRRADQRGHREPGPPGRPDQGGLRGHPCAGPRRDGPERADAGLAGRSAPEGPPATAPHRRPAGGGERRERLCHRRDLPWSLQPLGLRRLPAHRERGRRWHRPGWAPGPRGDRVCRGVRAAAGRRRGVWQRAPPARTPRELHRQGRRRRAVPRQRRAVLGGPAAPAHGARRGRRDCDPDGEGVGRPACRGARPAHRCARAGAHHPGRLGRGDLPPRGRSGGGQHAEGVPGGLSAAEDSSSPGSGRTARRSAARASCTRPCSRSTSASFIRRATRSDPGRPAAGPGAAPRGGRRPADEPRAKAREGSVPGSPKARRRGYDGRKRRRGRGLTLAALGRSCARKLPRTDRTREPGRASPWSASTGNDLVGGPRRSPGEHVDAHRCPCWALGYPAAGPRGPPRLVPAAATCWICEALRPPTPVRGMHAAGARGACSASRGIRNRPAFARGQGPGPRLTCSRSSR